MSDGDLRCYWSAEDVAQIAQEEGIEASGTLSSLAVGAPGISRAQVVAALRMMAAIPTEEG